MELPDLGKNCQNSNCNKLDFLPIECNKCSGIFCKDCISLDAHNCKSLTETKIIKKFEPKGDKCFIEKCQKFAVTQCPVCERLFCMDHRLEVDHECEKMTENRRNESLVKTEALVNSILAKKKQDKDPKVVKNQKMAAKVQLMKLKMKATGQKSIINEERLYFGVKCKKKKELSPIFVSGKWSLGKVIDTIADSLGLENRNNFENAAKLRLFKNIDGQILNTQLDISLEDLVKDETIFNGDTLIMEYVEDLETMQIDSKIYK